MVIKIAELAEFALSESSLPDGSKYHFFKTFTIGAKIANSEMRARQDAARTFSVLQNPTPSNRNGS
jgi:hypothetical protein